MKAHVYKLAFVALLLAGLLLQLQIGDKSASGKKPAATGIGDIQYLQAAYQRWKAHYVRQGGDRRLTLPLGYSKGLSGEFTKAQGKMTLDLIDGSLSVVISGLSAKEVFDVWLVKNRPGPGRSIKPEPGDAMVRVGSLRHEGDALRLQARLGQEALRGFQLDLVAVARAGKFPGEGTLFGSPSLFQRIFYSGERGEFAMPGGADAPSTTDGSILSLLSAPFRVLIPGPVYAVEAAGIKALESLVAQGEFIFFNETFNGNGRTCGTCHPAENNFTLNPAFIATRPPNDPLFVAEFNPDLKDLEKPKLMRLFGLILENVDGLEDPTHKFVMRGIPHTRALSTSLEPAPSIDGTTIPPNERTGWSGDGAPGSGTLRDFATGAIVQHFTRTLNRTPEVDFRLPTDAELDALEAFQLSLGRQADPSLPLPLKGARAKKGQEIFLDDSAGKCNICHANAGATASFAPGLNINFDTGVERLPGLPARLVDSSVPFDGGFGRDCEPATGCDPNNPAAGPFGNGTFNTPPLVEAADSGPFFHNNARQTIEGAVDFYNSDAFNDSPAGQFIGGIQLKANQVLAIAAFLRVINALENIRNSIELDNRAKLAGTLSEARRPLGVSSADIGDAIRVLEGQGLHLPAVGDLKNARRSVELARRTPVTALRNILINRAIAEQEKARGRMVEG